MSNKAVAILVVAVAGVAGWVWYAKGPGTTPTPPNGSSKPDAPIPAGLRSPPSEAAASTKGDANPPLPDAIAPVPPTPLAQAFESSNNLAQLIRDATPQVAAGDAQAARIVAQALDECAHLSIFPNFAEGIRKAASAAPADRRDATLAHLTRLQERCAELVSAEKITPEKLRSAFGTASQANDLVDQARRLVEASSAMSEADVKDTLRRIVESRNAEAIAVMADAMGESHDDRELFGPRSGSDISVMAWKLVACDLGLPCGPDSALVRHECMARSKCLPGGYKEIVRFFYLSPWAYELAVEQERAILQEIAKSEINLLFP